MDSASWTTLFRRIPLAQHDNLTLTAVNGMDISLQSIFRLDEEYMVVRGRLGGTTETGRVLIIPYDQITCVTFTRNISEAEVRSMLGGLNIEAATVLLDTKNDTEVLTVAEGQTGEPAKPAEAPAAAGANKTPVPPMSRPNLVDRLRNRPTPPPQQKPPSK